VQVLNGFDTRIIGSTNDYSKTANSEVVVVTSGIARKPGMTREELLGINSGIVKNVVTSVLEHSPNAKFVIVSNPMDTMTYLAFKSTGIAKNRVIGMGGALDSARFKYRLAEALGCPSSEIGGMVIGGHSDKGMLPLTRLATRNGVPVSNFLSAEKLEEVLEATKVGGATLTSLLGTSAWYAPGAAVSEVVQSILCDQKKMIPCSAFVDGEYGLNDVCVGVPCILGKDGIEKIVILDLNAEEKAKLVESTNAVKENNAEL